MPVDPPESNIKTQAGERDRLLDRALMTTFFNNIPDAVYFKDLKSRYIQLSVSCCHRFGKELPIDIIGRTDFDFYDAQHAQQTLADEQRIIHTGQPLFKKLEQEIWPDGRNSWVVSSKQPLRNDKGKIIGTFGFSKDVTKERELERHLEAAHNDLIKASHEAGKAEVAISVLHNVGNALNSVNISASMIATKLKQSKTDSLVKLVELISQHHSDLGGFLALDARGKKVPDLIGILGQHFLDQRDQLLAELQSLQSNVAHIKEIVAEQQRYATGAKQLRV